MESWELEYLLTDRGAKGWNLWRLENEEADIDLSLAFLTGRDLRGVNFSRANLREAYLRDADLSGADLRGADLRGADLFAANLIRADVGGANLSNADLAGADLSGASLREAILGGANLSGADLSEADLRGAYLRDADLSWADLSWASLVEADLTGAILDNCFVYGVSAWNVQLDSASQSNLHITRYDEPSITVDNLEVAQFLYLMLNNENIRGILETITSKVVLILGRFSPERKQVLDALRDALRQHPNRYVPVLFDFDVPNGKHILETVTLLARLARFVVADITDASMVRVELALIAPALPSVPILPLLQEATEEFAEFEFYTQYPWVLPVYRYHDIPRLLAALSDELVTPTERWIETRWANNPARN